jgi:hypothetical protein
MSVPISDHYLQLAYNADTVKFYNFADDSYPIQYLTEASFEYTAQGVSFSSGPVRKQKRIFTVSAYVGYSDWVDLDTVFSKWDEDRGKGENAKITIVSTLLTGNAETYYGFFTTPPSLQKVGPSNQKVFLVTTALSEV